MGLLWRMLQRFFLWCLGFSGKRLKAWGSSLGTCVPGLGCQICASMMQAQAVHLPSSLTDSCSGLLVPRWFYWGGRGWVRVLGPGRTPPDPLCSLPSLFGLTLPSNSRIGTRLPWKSEEEDTNLQGENNTFPKPLHPEKISVNILVIFLAI